MPILTGNKVSIVAEANSITFFRLIVTATNNNQYFLEIGTKGNPLNAVVRDALTALAATWPRPVINFEADASMQITVVH